MPHQAQRLDVDFQRAICEGSGEAAVGIEEGVGDIKVSFGSCQISTDAGANGLDDDVGTRNHRVPRKFLPKAFSPILATTSMGCTFGPNVMDSINLTQVALSGISPPMEQPALSKLPEVVAGFDLSAYKCTCLPKTLWRVTHPGSQSRRDVTTGDLVASDSTRAISDKTSLKQAAKEHFDWACRKSSCFLSVFGCEQHARRWAKSTTHRLGNLRDRHNEAASSYVCVRRCVVNRQTGYRSPIFD